MVLGGAIGTFVIVSILIYYSTAVSSIKLIALPSLIGVTAATISLIVSLAGAPIENFPNGKFDYIAHSVEDRGETIILWAWMPKFESSRLFKFDYTRKRMKKLNEAKKSTSSGQKMTGKFVKDINGRPDLSLQAGTIRPKPSTTKQPSS